MATHSARCNDSTVVFEIDDVSGALVSLQAKAGKRGMTIYLLDDDTITEIARFRVEPGESITPALKVRERIPTKPREVTQSDQRKVTKLGIPHWIDWT